MIAAMTSPMSKPAPAANAAGANAAKIPAPTIEPTPIATASVRPRRRPMVGEAVTGDLSNRAGVDRLPEDRNGSDVG